MPTRIPSPDWANAEKAKALMRVVCEAALQRQFGNAEKLEWLQSSRDDIAAGIGPISPRGENKTISEVMEDTDRRMRRARFHAVLARRAYTLADWLPPEALLHLRRVDLYPDTGRVVIILWGGAQILDTGDRIVLRGELEEFATAEMAACAGRRGWRMVEVSGDSAFRAEVSRELLAMGIEVVDCPLSEDDQDELRRCADRDDWRMGYVSLGHPPLPVPGSGMS